MGFEVLFKGTNAIRLLKGLGVALQISFISVGISIVLGIFLGMIMTAKNKVVEWLTGLYLEIVRLMPQMVLLFLVYFGATKAMGLNLSAELSAVILLGNGRDGRSGSRSPAKHSRHSVREQHDPGLYKMADLSVCDRAADYQTDDSFIHQFDHPHDKNHQSGNHDRYCGSIEGRATDY